METLKYTLIKKKSQYIDYCNRLEVLVFNEKKEEQDEIDLLNLLIEKWDKEHNSLNELDPVEMIKALMEEHALKAKDLVNILAISKGTVSKILNYQKGLSKASIRKLAEHFSISQESLNRPYTLKQELYVQ